MKRILLLVVLALVVSLMSVGIAGAIPYLVVDGRVNYFMGDINDNGDGTSTITELFYKFTVVGASGGATMTSLTLDFQTDIFLDGNFETIMPSNWSHDFLEFPALDLVVLAMYGGTPISMGESLKIGLTDVIIDSDALVDPTLWDQGQIWSQSYDGGEALGGAGSTVPEPGTLMLLGLGLGGVAFYARRKKV